MISKLLGAREVMDGRLQAVLSEKVRGSLGYRSFVRVRLRVSEGGLVAEPLKVQKSSALASMVDADGFVVIPEGANEIPAGERVEVTLLK
jgi:molybdopterin molybdotransferase